MKNIFPFLFALNFLTACTNTDSAPDVSNIKVEVPVERFEKDFFSIDTIAIENGLRDLGVKYPSLFPIFIRNILGLNDSIKNKGVELFIRQNKFISDAANKEFEN